jgi:hypothetical protein
MNSGLPLTMAIPAPRSAHIATSRMTVRPKRPANGFGRPQQRGTLSGQRKTSQPRALIGLDIVLEMF